MVSSALSVNKIWCACFSQKWQWLFWTEISCLIRLKPKSRTLANWSLIFSGQQRTWSQKWIWNDHMEHSSIYLAAEGYKTENKMHVDVKCQWETRAAAWFQIYFITKSQGRELGSPVLLIFRKYCCCLVGSNFLTMADSLNVFSFPYYVMTAYSPLCPALVSVMFCLSAVTLPKLQFILGSTLSVDYFTLAKFWMVLLISRSVV